MLKEQSGCDSDGGLAIVESRHWAALKAGLGAGSIIGAPASAGLHRRARPRSVSYGSAAVTTASSTPKARATLRNAAKPTPASPVSIRRNVFRVMPARSATWTAVSPLKFPPGHKLLADARGGGLHAR
jgi:hypothetical protein